VKSETTRWKAGGVVYFDAMSREVGLDVVAGVAVLTLNRPEHLNAYTADMGASLSQAYRDCDENDDVRAIVVTGAGHAFCAGADFSGGSSPFDTPGSEGVNAFLERRAPRFGARLSTDWEPL
jgi:1,4-dihydroxy-2-naphthoyl-CoA synthase